MIRLTKIFTFETAHALYGYLGKCKNIHGHSYKLHVTISGIPSTDVNSPNCGMIMDFGDLKKIVNQHIIEVYDHAILLNRNSPSRMLGEHLITQNHKVEFMDIQPTCENMLYLFADILKNQLPDYVKLESLKLYETETSYGEWIRQNNE